MLIEKTKPGRKDGGYTRLFGDEELGALISRVHSASISAGTELEKIIISKVRKINNATDLFEKKISEGIFLIDKKQIKKSFLQGKQEPDFLIVKIKEEECYIIELKDGDNFDTKKSQGEIVNLKAYAHHISSKIAFKTSIHVCFFNQNNKEKIVSGFKGNITKEQAMTGEEFCNLLAIDYKAIISAREKDQQENINFFIKELKKIDKLKEL